MYKSIKNDIVYLLNILEYIEKIFIYSKDCDNAEDFYNKDDQLNFNATLTLFTQIGENVPKISDELKTQYPQIDWMKIKDFRNKITHEYAGIDIFVVYNIIKNDLIQTKKEISAVVREQLNKKVFDKDEFETAKASQYYKHIDFSQF